MKITVIGRGKVGGLAAPTRIGRFFDAWTIIAGQVTFAAAGAAEA